ncbi:MAG: P-type conjugative transfer protein TrbJ [Rhizobiaceae bacterium]|nr:P-type conjugative transfer protein TrbJ [Rhizobiaceae bacterium]MCZ8351768.1 P-type conjugative transfer protein TrbJ [Rhizobium sp.]
MPCRFLTPEAGSSRPALIFALQALSLAVAPCTFAGAAAGPATEWTQLANNAELVGLLDASGVEIDNQLTQITQLSQQIQNQLQMYQTMLQNTARLPSAVWGAVEADLLRLKEIAGQGEGIAFAMANTDQVLAQRFPTYAQLKDERPQGESFAHTYETWSSTNRATIAASLKVAGLTADQFEGEEQTMRSLRLLSETSDGQMKALQVGHGIAVEQVAQLQKLRALFSQQMALSATWLQSEQGLRDLAQARRDTFFKATVRAIAPGQKMEPRW